MQVVSEIQCSVEACFSQEQKMEVIKNFFFPYTISSSTFLRLLSLFLSIASYKLVFMSNIYHNLYICSLDFELTSRHIVFYFNRQ